MYIQLAQAQPHVLFDDVAGDFHNFIIDGFGDGCIAVDGDASLAQLAAGHQGGGGGSPSRGSRAARQLVPASSRRYA